MESFRLRVVEVTRTSTQKLQISALDLGQTPPNDHDNGFPDQKCLKTIVLEGVWAQNNNIIKNSKLHLLNPLYDQAADVYTVNNSSGFLVIEPDDLLTCTLVASSLFCERKTWLNHVFLGQVGTNRAMLVGTLVHECFQHGVKNRIADVETLTKFLDDMLDDATVMLEAYSVELHLNDIRKEAISYLSSVKEWIDKYMFTGPRFALTNDSNLEVKVIGVNDIEENVWSTKYGLKGKIDVTGSVRIYDKRNKSLADKTIPLELKTGNPNLSASHAAQVSLYSMMIEDRYAETNQGFVIYLKDKAAMHNVALTHNVKRDLIQRRNQINYHMKSYFFGPDMIDQARMCKGCERLTECVLMSNLYETGKIDREYPTMKSLEKEATGHLDGEFIKFFQKYHEKLVRLMMKSSSAIVQVNGDSKTSASVGSSGSFWTYSSEEAEARGTGFGKLKVLTPSNAKKNTSGFVTFKRHPDYAQSLEEQQTTKNGKHEPEVVDIDSSPVTKKQKISDFFKPAPRNRVESDNSETLLDGKRLKPFNTELDFSRCRIAISLDLDDQTMDSQNSSTAIAIGFMQELKNNELTMKIYEGAANSLKPNLVYRVDKLEKRVQLDIERTVLVRLLAREDWRCDRVRRLILDPTFEPMENLELNLFVLEEGFEEISELESAQQKFVVEAVSTDNYFVVNEKIEPNKARVHKSIAVLARVITTLERSLLVVAQNVDDLLDLMRMLQRKKLRFILIDDGKSSKARYQFASFLVKVPQEGNLDLSKKYDMYIRQHEAAPIVITSYAMSIGGLLFTRRKFDYCVAYDCDKTELLVSLSPMFCSDRFIIIDIRDKDKENSLADEAVIKGEDISLGDHLRSLRRGGIPQAKANK